jgi:hypothetical protein
VGINPTRGLNAEYPVSLRDEQVTVVLREDRRDETAMKKLLLGSDVKNDEIDEGGVVWEGCVWLNI